MYLYERKAKRFHEGWIDEDSLRRQLWKYDETGRKRRRIKP